MENNKVTYDFKVNAFSVKAEYFQEDIDGVFLPLVQKLEEIKRNSGGRIIVYLAGPGGAGKTTLSLLLESLAAERIKGVSVQSIGIDGFHYTLEYVNNHYVDRDGEKILMRDVRGSAETYDFEKLRQKIKELKYGDVYWPRYDRTIHDVVEDAIFVNGEIVIIEGNWLLLDEPCWRDLIQYCDYSVFIEVDRDVLIERLTERKVKGGLDRTTAENFVMRSDAKNVDRIMGNRLRYDLGLKYTKDGHYVRREFI